MAKFKDFQKTVYKGKPDLYRRIFTPFVWILVRLHIHPNVISLFRFINMFFTAYFFLIEQFWIGALLLQLNIVLDISDGALARYFNKASSRGELIDNILDHLYSQVLVFVPLILINPKWFVGGIILSHLSVYFRAICLEINKEKTKVGKFIEKLFRQDNNRFVSLLVLIGCTTANPVEGIAFLLLLFILIKNWVLATYLIISGVNIFSLKLIFNYLLSACYYVTRKEFFKNKLDTKYAIARYVIEHKT